MEIDKFKKVTRSMCRFLIELEGFGDPLDERKNAVDIFTLGDGLTKLCLDYDA